MFIGVLFRCEYLLAASRHKLVSLIAQKMFERTETNLERIGIRGADNFQSKIMEIID